MLSIINLFKSDIDDVNGQVAESDIKSVFPVATEDATVKYLKQVSGKSGKPYKVYAYSYSDTVDNQKVYALGATPVLAYESIPTVGSTEYSGKCYMLEIGNGCYGIIRPEFICTNQGVDYREINSVVDSFFEEFIQYDLVIPMISPITLGRILYLSKKGTNDDEIEYWGTEITPGIFLF